MPGHLTQIEGIVYDMIDDIDGFKIDFELNTYGNLETGNTCPNAGPIFNPFAEVENSYADPSIGTINQVTILAAEANEDNEFSFTQKKFYQNLSGKNSIIGRSIKTSVTNLIGTTMELECCVIGLDSPPYPGSEQPTAFYYYPQNNYHYQYRGH